MNKIHPLAIISILSGLIGLGTFAIAAAAADPGPCAADIQKFCAGVQPGGGAIAQCLKAHQADLSEACKERGEELKQKFQSFTAACQEDLQKYCKDVQPGAGRKIKCLKDNAANLAPNCKAQVDHMQSGVRIQPGGTPSQPPPAAPDTSDAH